MAISPRTLADELREQYHAKGIETPRHALEDIFEEEPVDLTTFVQDSAYLENPPLSPEQFVVVRHLEQIYLPDLYPSMVEYFGPQWKPVRFVNFAWIQWGKGSGKDHVCRIAAARIAYLLLCLHSPQRYFGMPRQDWIHTLNIAAAAQQAHRAFFRPLADLVRVAPCFKDRSDPREYSIRYDKHIESISGHSESGTQEGLNLLLGIADEISEFKTREEAEKTSRSTGREPTKTADNTIKMMRTSARTRFPGVFKIAAISYPRFKGDPIQQLCARGREDYEKRGEKSRTFVSGPLPTWEVNPRVSGKEEFQEDYDEDPDMARAMYECKPEASVNRFFRNKAALFAALGDHDRQTPIEVEYYWGIDESFGDISMTEGDVVAKQQPGWQVKFHFAEDFVPIRGAIYAMHGDIAINGDRAGVAMCHVRKWAIPEWQTAMGATAYEPRPVVKLDFVTAFEADLRADPQPREVQIRWYRKLVWTLKSRGFDVIRVTFDGYQSTDAIQILTAWGVESERVSTEKVDVYDNLRDVMYDDRLEGYWVPKLLEEFEGLTRLPNGKVDHPPGGSKDMADAVAGACLGALELGGDEGENPQRADQPYAVDEFGTGDAPAGDFSFPLGTFGLQEGLGEPELFGSEGL